MTYIAAADFRLGTLKPWTANIALSEADGTNAWLDLVIATVTTQVELDLHDDFEPPNPDSDETLVTAGNGLTSWHPPRRVRSLTTVSTIDSAGMSTAQTGYRLDKSLNAAGTAMVDGRKLDTLQAIDGFTLPCWPDAPGSVSLVGKFGWAAVPDDIKRLAALRVHDLVKATSDPHTTLVQRTTIDAVNTYGPSAEEQRLVDRYARFAVMSA